MSTHPVRPRSNSSRRFGIAVLMLGACVVCLQLCGCSLLKEPIPTVANPVPALTEVALIPVGAHDAEASLQWTQQLHQALLRVDGIQRIHVVPASSKDDTESFLKSAHHCLLEVNVLDFDAYYPPRALVEVHFYVPPGSTPTAWDPIRLERLGTAQGSHTADDRGPWLRFQKSYDIDDYAIMESLERYARGLGDDDRGLDPVDRVVMDSDRFIDFVFYETLRECFARLNRKEVESNGFLSELLDGGP